MRNGLGKRTTVLIDWLGRRLSYIYWLRVRLGQIHSRLNIRLPFVRYGILLLGLNWNVVDRWVILPSDDVFDSE